MVKNIEYEDAYSPYTLRMEHKNQKVVLEYNKTILKDRARWLKQIMTQIDQCIEKSFHISKTESP